MMNPLPDTRRVHGLVLQHERQLNVMSHREPVAHAMQTHRPNTQKGGPSSGNLNPRRGPKCSHCDGSHSIDRCYFLIGFPEGHKWHGKRVFPRNKHPPTTHNVDAFSSQGSLPAESKGTVNDSPTFTTEEYHQILALLRSGNGKSIPLANATDHATDSPVLPILQPDPSPHMTGPLPNTQTSPHGNPLHILPPSPSTANPIPDPTLPSPTSPEPTQHSSPSPEPTQHSSPSSTSPTTPIPVPPALPDHTQPNPPLPTRHSSRLTRPPARLKDYVAHHSALLSPNITSSSVSGTRHPIHRKQIVTPDIEGLVT
ncbi:hypothetical protein DKX38_017728 [Salix brachista]|uniref:Uncharacterized protein n=1 Tax=Salix brachista TaxID=2182728 RepID=A0A5N5KWF1_9ROSI|nr:hypothetical protein DKX38_017728 [Salix brachista]